MHRPFLFPFLLLATLIQATVSTAFGQAYGLTSRPNVAAYLDGAMPPEPPVLSTTWSTVVAFPNLTFLNPLGLLPMPGTTKLVVWEREGRVYHFENNAATATKTLIVDFSSVCQGWDDSGMLGLAFHPQFSLSGAVGTNRHMFVWYNHTRPGIAVVGSPNARPDAGQDTINRLSRFTLDANGVAVAGSELVIIEQNDSSVWHNGGGMFFHPSNGFLYITNGDDSDGANNQRINTSLFSGVLRIDVDKRGGAISHAPPKRAVGEVSPNWPQYFIPNDNPFIGVPNALEEFYAIALRSPHRMTIDPPTGRIFIGDVGGGSREEISTIEPNDPPGLNFQWDRIEGYNGDLVQPYIGVNKRPVIDYPHGADGAAIIGGYVYRGTEFPELYGKYIFGDNISNRVWALDESTLTATTPASKILLTTLPKGPGPNSGNDYVGLSSFGIDANNELYMCQLSSTAGKIYKFQRGGPPPTAPLPARLSLTGAFSNTAALTPSNKLIPYALNEPFWSDGAVKTRWATVPNATTVGFAATGEWTWPAGSVMVKHFELPVDDLNPAIRKRLETRLLVKMATGAVYGATYRWRADNSDADLMDSAITENVPIAIAAPGNFTGADVGAPALAGSTVRAGNELTISAGGADIWGTADQFHFAHQQRTGDFDISVRISSLTQADLYTKAGLMARESLAAGSRHIFALAFPSNAARNNNVGGYEFQSRTATNGPSTAIYPAVPQPTVNFPNTWLRLRREGNTFIAYSSVDGVWWAEFARQTLSLPATVFFGPAVTSHNAAALTTAKVQLQTTRIQPWYYPSRSDCVICHSTVAGGVLGPKTRQLNGNLLYPNVVTDNQIRSWAHVGLFDAPPAEATIPTLDKLAAHGDLAAPLEKRARSYLDSNCASCHRPGAAQAFWDARFDTPLAAQGIVYGQVANNLGDPSARVVVPQDLLRSIMHRRASAVGGGIQMPPLAKNMVDQSGVDVLADWINSLPPNTPPVVTLTSPANGAVYSQGDAIALSATASDADGIAKVEFYDGGNFIGEDNSAPYQFTWTGALRGNHLVTAVAIDNVGNNTASAVAGINVQGIPLPSPWQHSDIGAVGFIGDAFFANGAFDITGGGDDIWGTADAFHFVHRSLIGDGEIVARVVSLENTDGWAKSGVMMRETLAAGSAHAFSMISAGNGAGFQRRALTDFLSEHTAGPGVGAPYWVRLVRSGNTFTAYASATGTGWTLVGTQQVTMAQSIYVGLAVTAHNNGLLAESVIDNVTVTGASNPVVTLTSPAHQSVFYDPATIALTATASDPDEAIARVEFLVDGTEVGEDLTAPYSFSWSAPTYGTHQLAARAVAIGGGTTTSTPASVTVNIPNVAGLRGEYYDNMDFTNLAMVRADATVNFDWGNGSPDPRLDVNTYSVRWTGTIRPRYTQTYTFTTNTDDGVRLWVNNQLIIDQWVDQGPTNHTGTIALVANQSYDLRMDYYENGGGAVARLSWSSPSQALEIIPASRMTVPPPPNASPSITLTAPGTCTAFLTGDSIALSATASDTDGSIARVEFWANGVKLGEDVSAPYTWDWAGPRPVGQHLVWATAFDNGGANTSSTTANIQSVAFTLTPISAQRLTNPDRTVFTIRTTLPAGRNYVIEWTANLTDWTLLQSGTSNGTPIELIDIAAGIERRFYHVRLVP